MLFKKVFGSCYYYYYIYIFFFNVFQESCSFLEMPEFPGISYFFDGEAILIVIGWVAFQAILSLLPIGKCYCGEPLPNGEKLGYRCNGKHCPDN